MKSLVSGAYMCHDYLYFVALPPQEAYLTCSAVFSLLLLAILSFPHPLDLFKIIIIIITIHLPTYLNPLQPTHTPSPLPPESSRDTHTLTDPIDHEH